MGLKLLIVIITLKALIIGAHKTTLSSNGNSMVGEQCITKSGKSGLCLHETLCFDDKDHTVAVGGILESNEVRLYNWKCKNRFFWCCTLPENKKTTTTVPTTSKPIETKTTGETSRCLLTTDNSCPWCVALYIVLRSGIKTLFCGGVLIGKKVVLSLATCKANSERFNILATLPESEPGTYYEVTERHHHLNYNSATLENDFALFVLNKEVPNIQGACLDVYGYPREKQCYAFGFNTIDKIQSSILSVNKGSCTDYGMTMDVFCGKKFSTYCIANSGLPIVCLGPSNVMLVGGNVRRPCMDDRATLGSIQQSYEWLRLTLQNLGVEESQYIHVPTNLPYYSSTRV